MRFYNRIFFSLFTIIKSKGIKPFINYWICKKYQWYNNSQRINYQILKINALLDLVVKKNNFYQETFIKEKGKISKLDDIKNYPILIKKDIKDNYAKLITPIKGPYYYGSTSGSTGFPLKFLISQDYLAKQMAAYWRFLGWHKINPYDKYVVLWGSKTFKKERFISKISKTLYHQTYKINIFDLNEKSFIYHYHKLLKFKPIHFRSYTSGAKQFAVLADKLNYDLRKIGIKLITVTSEILHEEDRIYIEKIFGCKVANEYGASEIGQFAFECPENGLHICDDINFIWTNKEDEVFVTNYFNLKFPFINYKIGDRIILSDRKCNCGRTLPLIDRIEGRTGDQIVTPSGKKLSQYFFYYLFDEIAYKFGIGCIIQYKIIQKGNRFKMQLIKGTHYSGNSIEYLRDRMHKEIGNDIDIKIIFTSEIEKDKSGKFQFFHYQNS